VQATAEVTRLADFDAGVLDATDTVDQSERTGGLRKVGHDHGTCMNLCALFATSLSVCIDALLSRESEVRQKTGVWGLGGSFGHVTHVGHANRHTLGRSFELSDGVSSRPARAKPKKFQSDALLSKRFVWKVIADRECCNPGRSTRRLVASTPSTLQESATRGRSNR
jgi:hypothetical protein